MNVALADGTEIGPDHAAALLSALLRFVTQEAFRYMHEWEPGDCMLWDNLACLHCVMPWDYENESGEQRRVMWRQTIGVEDTTHGAGQVDRVRHPPFAAVAVS